MDNLDNIEHSLAGSGTRKLIERFIRLLAGLFLYAMGIVLTMKANIGYAPWEVFHAGLGKTIGMTIGNVSIITGLLIVILTFVMGEKLGLGTLLNMVLIGVFMDFLLRLGIIPLMDHWQSGLMMLTAGLFVISLASFFYIGSGFGAGPRDSLMVALTRKIGLPVGLCRGGIELAAVISGWVLGGMVGVGTVISAFVIGLCVQVTFQILRFDPTQVHHETLDQTMRRIAATGKRKV